MEREIGLLTEYEDPIYKNKIILATLVSSCADSVEDWAVFKRCNGHFAFFAHICPEVELPAKNAKIGIRYFPVGLVTSSSSNKLTIQSFEAKVAQYELFDPINISIKRRKGNGGRVVDTEPVRDTKMERELTVVGGRVNSCGAPYFSPNNKVLAFHVQRLDNNSDSISISNSYTSDRCHTSYSHGLVLCRLPKFKNWFNTNIVPILGVNSL
jgi:hypothetical protein